jgi:hypothetical protein
MGIVVMLWAFGFFDRRVHVVRVANPSLFSLFFFYKSSFFGRKWDTPALTIKRAQLSRMPTPSATQSPTALPRSEQAFQSQLLHAGAPRVSRRLAHSEPRSCRPSPPLPRDPASVGGSPPRTSSKCSVARASPHQQGRFVATCLRLATRGRSVPDADDPARMNHSVHHSFEGLCRHRRVGDVRFTLIDLPNIQNFHHLQKVLFRCVFDLLRLGQFIQCSRVVFSLSSQRHK